MIPHIRLYAKYGEEGGREATTSPPLPPPPPPSPAAAYHQEETPSGLTYPHNPIDGRVADAGSANDVGAKEEEEERQQWDQHQHYPPT